MRRIPGQPATGRARIGCASLCSNTTSVHHVIALHASPRTTARAAGPPTRRIAGSPRPPSAARNAPAACPSREIRLLPSDLSSWNVHRHLFPASGHSTFVVVSSSTTRTSGSAGPVGLKLVRREELRPGYARILDAQAVPHQRAMAVRPDHKLRVDRNALSHHRLPMRHDVACSGPSQLLDRGGHPFALLLITVEPMAPIDGHAGLLQPLLQHLLNGALGQNQQEGKGPPSSDSFTSRPARLRGRRRPRVSTRRPWSTMRFRQAQPIQQLERARVQGAGITPRRCARLLVNDLYRAGRPRPPGSRSKAPPARRQPPTLPFAHRA